MFIYKTDFIKVPGNCASNPCLNRGSCYNTSNSFICVCSGQWSGPTCGILNSMTTTAVPTPPGKLSFSFLI